MAQFTTDIFAQFDKKWAPLCAGTKESMFVGEVVEIIKG